MLPADAPTDIQAPITHLMPAATPTLPARDRRALRAAVLTGVILLDAGLAAWALMSLRVAWILLRMHG